MIDKIESILDSIYDAGGICKHCPYDGFIYSGHYEKRIVDLMEVHGKPQIPSWLSKYEITSGICPVCYKEQIKKLEDLIANGNRT